MSSHERFLRLASLSRIGWLVIGLLTLPIAETLIGSAGLTAAQPTEMDIEAGNIVRNFTQATDPARWIEINRHLLTPNFLAAIQRLVGEATQRGKLEFARAAQLLVALALQQNGDRRRSLIAFGAYSVLSLTLANSVDDFNRVRDEAKSLSDQAGSFDAPDLAFRARVIASEASYSVTKKSGLDATTMERWQKNVLVDLVDAAQLSRLIPWEDPNRMWLERFASMVGAVIFEASRKYGYGGEEELKHSFFKALTGPLEDAIPVNFSYQQMSGKGWLNALGLAEVLARLSYSFGNTAIGRARLEFAAETARGHGETALWTDIVFQLYLGERSARPERLPELRNSLRGTFSELRTNYLSRAGRLWVANNADRILGELAHDEINSAGITADEAFGIAEALKARLLLDQLIRPFVPLRDSNVASRAEQIERDLIAFPSCMEAGGWGPWRPTNDLAVTELAVLSRHHLARPIGPDPSKLEQEQIQHVKELEGFYRQQDAGFKGAAALPVLSDVQARLRADEAIIEYFLPFNQSDPARELWILIITRDRAALERAPLEAMGFMADSILSNRLPIPGSKPFSEPTTPTIGVVQVGNCPPIDITPLSDAIATLRVALQSSDEAKSLRFLRILHQLLIEPVVRAGFDPAKFHHWIVVPYGPIHYVPFAALTDARGRFLIQDVALSTMPSAAVWLHLQARPPSEPQHLVGFFAPVVGDLSLPALPSSAREINAIRKGFSNRQLQLLSGMAATRAQLQALAPLADILHFSTHGDFPELNAIDFHAILLSKDGADDGRIAAEDIRKVDLTRAALVVLLICNGGLYNTGPSDEPYGLIPAFLSAGAANILGPLWPLEDEFGRIFVARFYNDGLMDGPAEALRKTMVSFIGEGELIRRWSGMVVVGPGRAFQLP